MHSNCPPYKISKGNIWRKTYFSKKHAKSMKTYQILKQNVKNIKNYYPRIVKIISTLFALSSVGLIFTLVWRPYGCVWCVHTFIYFLCEKFRYARQNCMKLAFCSVNDRSIKKSYFVPWIVTTPLYLWITLWNTYIDTYIYYSRGNAHSFVRYVVVGNIPKYLNQRQYTYHVYSS